MGGSGCAAVVRVQAWIIIYYLHHGGSTTEVMYSVPIKFVCEQDLVYLLVCLLAG